MFIFVHFSLLSASIFPCRCQAYFAVCVSKSQKGLKPLFLALQVHILRTGSVEKAKHKVLHSAAAAAAAASAAAAFAVLQSQAVISSQPHGDIIVEQTQMVSPQSSANESPKLSSRKTDTQNIGNETSIQEIVVNISILLAYSVKIVQDIRLVNFSHKIVFSLLLNFRGCM